MFHFSFIAAVRFICEHPDIRAISFVGSDTAVSAQVEISAIIHNYLKQIIIIKKTKKACNESLSSELLFLVRENISMRPDPRMEKECSATW